MIKIKIPNSEVQELLTGKKYSYPKYATQIMNLANQNAQGTRARIVGQMSDLIQKFEGTALSEWEKWYLEGHPEAIDVATAKVFDMVKALSESITKIDRDMVKEWVSELVIAKTFSGLKFQQAILQKVAKTYAVDWRLATKEEESKMIDGYIGNIAVSIKPISYKVKLGLNEKIEIPVIFYDKKKDSIVIECDLPIKNK